MIEVKDPVYGAFGIKEPVLIELMNSKPVQRLKGITQLGVPEKYNKFSDFSRYEHSIGVMLLLRKLGASIEEQIAGLLHDVSHTAFSHIADRIWGDPKKEDFQDNNHWKIIKDSEIPQILQKYGFDAKRISELEAFTLLDKDIPELCADRIDYSLREGHYWAHPEAIGEILDNLTVKNNQIVLKTRKSAELFAKLFLKLQREHWGSDDGIIRHKIFSEVLKNAMEKNIISKADFLKDDNAILEVIENSNNEFIAKGLKFLSENKLIIHGGKTGDVSYKKFRYIDPLYLEGDELKRLSETSQEFNESLREAREQNQRGVKIQISTLLE